MDIFAFAMKMEMDGRMFYIEQAHRTAQPELKKILLELADDEQKHFNIFKALHEGSQTEYKESEKTHILSTVKNVFEQMRSGQQKFSFPPDAKKLWEEAREVERKAEEFYRAKAKEVTSVRQREILHKIADEEHRHWVTLQNVIQFLDRPNHWLEDAEWVNLEEY